MGQEGKTFKLRFLQTNDQLLVEFVNAHFPVGGGDRSAVMSDMITNEMPGEDKDAHYLTILRQTT